MVLWLKHTIPYLNALKRTSICTLLHHIPETHDRFLGYVRSFPSFTQKVFPPPSFVMLKRRSKAKRNTQYI